jgi:hypothetical protein
MTPTGMMIRRQPSISMEEKMGRRIPRDLRPSLEQFERRDLLSAITDIMAANSVASSQRSQSASASQQALNLALSQANASAGSTQSIAVPSNQGPLIVDGKIVNAALAPTGTLTRRELRRERFVAQYVGTYTVGPGRTSDEANQTFITAAGSANTMLHSDIQMLLVTPKDSSNPIGGVSTIFDRNLNTNTVLGFDLSAPQQDVDRGGRPDYIPTVSVDVNVSSGTYVEAYSVGTISIKYIPSGKHTPGVFSQGKAIVTIRAQIYTTNASFILRNANIDP